MSNASLLDADMTTLAGWARSGFGWWIEELRGLVPPGLEQRLGARPAVVATYENGSFHFARRGAAMARGSGPLAVTLALPESAALVRSVRLPAIGLADLKRLIAFEAERLLPFPPGAALTDFEAAAASDGSQTIALAGLPVTPARAALAAAEDEGLTVRRLAIVADGGLRFDFLPGLKAAAMARQRRNRLLWWAIAAFALLALLGTLIVRDIYLLSQTEALVEAHGQAAQTARLLKARVIAEDSRRRNLLDRRRTNDPLAALAATTTALPDTVWTQRLALESGQLRLGGFKAANADVVALLRRSPAFGDVHNTAVDVAANTEGITQPFEVAAELRH